MAKYKALSCIKSHVMKNQWFCWALLCLCFISCGGGSRQGKVKQIDAPTKGNVLYSFDGSIDVLNLYVCDSNLVAFTYQEPFFSIISIKDKELINSFGRKGRAKGEFPNVPQGVNLREGSLQFFNYPTKSLFFLSIPDGSMKSCQIPYNVDFRPTRVVEVEGKRITTGAFENGSVAYVDADQHIVIGEDFPFDTAPLSGIYRGAMVQSGIFAAPDIPMVLIITLASDCFEIYKIDSDGFQRTFVNDFKNPPVIKNRMLDFRESVAGYIRCYVDNDYIYLMHSEGSYLDASNEGLFSSEIHQYDWEGNLNQIIQLPEKVGAFCVKGKSLFGTLELLDHSEIVEYIIE